MQKTAAKAPWEIAIEKLATTVAQTFAEADKRAAEADKRAEARAAEAKKEMAELRSIMGIYTTDESEILERDVVAAIVGKMSLGGIKFNRVTANQHVYGKCGNGEFDWIGINGKTVVVGETRRTLKRGDARRFFSDRMELFKRAYPNDIKGKEVRGALICQKAKAGAVEEALKLNMLVFCAEGDKTLRPVETPADIPRRTETKTYKRP